MIPISKIKPNPSNPRSISDADLERLSNSIKDFPKMMELRPIVVDENNIVLGGNMRLKALKKLGYKEVPKEWVKSANDLTEDEQRRFIIQDNTSGGEWDTELLATDWDKTDLEKWGLDIEWGDNLSNESENDEYTKKITSPTYEVKNKKPEPTSLYDIEKTKKLIEEIDSSDCNPEDKQFLKLAAQRHCVFNYELIADFYAHSEKNVQKLMEDSALVIIDFDRAIELGYVKLSEEIAKQYGADYDEE